MGGSGGVLLGAAALLRVTKGACSPSAAGALGGRPPPPGGRRPRPAPRQRLGPWMGWADTHPPGRVQRIVDLVGVAGDRHAEPAGPQTVKHGDLRSNIVGAGGQTLRCGGATAERRPQHNTTAIHRPLPSARARAPAPVVSRRVTMSDCAVPLARAANIWSPASKRHARRIADPLLPPPPRKCLSQPSTAPPPHPPRTTRRTSDPACRGPS